ncbi:DUF6225 family protein [Streptomyces kaempferi]|uniref:DUF6225 family protein n=1 Tax=Streptomyces kaempferi TaxID=333725 RepID=A0ABW3XIV5_9ACTN
MTHTESTRPAHQGELCTCGRQAITVIQTAEFGDVGYCGIEGAAFDPVLPCPWCGTREPHKESWGDPGRCSAYRIRPDQGTEAAKEQWTVGRLRAALAEHPDDTPLRVSVPGVGPDGWPSLEYVVTDFARTVAEYHPDGNITPTDFLVIYSSTIGEGG